MNDRELLRQYTLHGSEDAFRTLVERYTPIVYSSAWRRAGDAVLAEDITQAVFIIFVRKARSLEGYRDLTGWMVSTTKRTAHTALRAEQRRRKREIIAQERKDMEEKPYNADRVWQDLRPILDSAMDRLSSKDRTAILLRYFKSYSFAQVGEALDISENTAAKRVERALEKLKKIVSKKRVMVTSALLGTILGSKAVEAVPQGLAATCADTALGAGSGGAVASSSGAIAQHTMRALMWAKVKAAAAAVAAVALVTVGSAAGLKALAEPQSGVPVQRLDLTRGYWRYYYYLRPPEYDKELVAQETAKLKAAKRRGRRRLLDPGKVNYVDYWAHRCPMAHLVNSPPPASNWNDPDFDDSLWPREIRPFGVGLSKQKWHAAGSTCFRTSFIIDNPEDIKKLTLEIGFRGGAAVYVNGKELGRFFLPEGKLGPDTPGTFYPLRAYSLPETDKFPSKLRGGKLRPLPELIGEFPGPKGPTRITNKMFEEDPGSFKIPVEDVTHLYHEGRYTGISRDEWNEVRMLRSRKSGPVEIPAGILRKGVNVLAIEIRRSSFRPYQSRGTSWIHGAMLEAVLTCGPAGSVRTEDKGEKTQVWTEDINRLCFSKDFGPSGDTITPIRMIAAKNSVCSGQVLIRSHKELRGVEASAAPLKTGSGPEVPVSAIKVRYGKGRPGKEMRSAGYTGYSGHLLSRYIQNLPSRSRKARVKAADRIHFFDQLCDEPPGTVAAGTCQPVWITVSVPKNTIAGFYTGTLTVKTASHSFEVPVRLQVIDWTMPDPKEFKTIMGLDQSPWGVAKQYKVPLWSDRHFELMERSMYWLGQIGNNVVMLPVAAKTEYGNRNDSMVRWIRNEDRTYACDFSIARRYLETAKKYMDLRIVCFVVRDMSEVWPKWYLPVKFSDGTVKRIDAPDPNSEQGIAMWEPFVKGTKQLMNELGLEKSLYLGFSADVGGPPSTAKLKSSKYSAKTKNRSMSKYLGEKEITDALKKWAPDVGWSRACHVFLRKDTHYTFQIGLGRNWLSPPARMDRKTGKAFLDQRLGWTGWKYPQYTFLSLTRYQSPAVPLMGFDSPFKHRIIAERTIAAGLRGVGRWGADFWAGVYGRSARGPLADSVVNVAQMLSVILWPGENGADSSVRFEALREGVQEAEVRVFLEGRLQDKAFAGSEQGRTVQKVLDDRLKEIHYVPPHGPAKRVGEYYGRWQERSWDLYAAAAEASGGKAPSAEEKRAFFK